MSGHVTAQNVNLELGDRASHVMSEAAKLTYQNRPGLVDERYGSFFGFHAMDGAYFGDISNHYFNIGLDGVGTKVEIAERTGSHSTIAQDLFAMVCDDAVVRGGEPVVVGTILDINHLEDNTCTHAILDQLAKGYAEAAAMAGVVVTNGEIAELGNRVGGYQPDVVFSVSGKDEDNSAQPFNYNWGGVVVWFAHKSRVLDGSKIRPGDSLVGLPENGFRSNGITAVRGILREVHGEKWHEEHIKELGSLTLGKLVQTSSVIYSRFINKLTGGFDIEKEPVAKLHGVASITGGGQPEKIGRMLAPSGYGAVIDEPIKPPEIMRYAQEIGGYTDEKAYETWHMGPGMVIATPDPEAVLLAADKTGQPAKRIGEITEKPGISIRSAGVENEGKYLKF